MRRGLRFNDLDIVKAHSLIVSHDSQTLLLGLSDEHPIERVFMMRRQLLDRQRVFGCDVQGSETMQA